MAKRENYDSNVTITGTSSADIIHNYGGNNVSISAGAGNDSVTVAGGHNVTVSGGKGNDFVRHEWGVGTVYVYTSGNDTLESFTHNTSLVIADKWSSVRSDDSTVIISVEGKGTITLSEYESGRGDLEIVSSVSKATHYNLNWNDDSNRTLNGTSKADYFWNTGHLVKIDGKSGNNYIDNTGSYSTVNGGSGNDFIGNWDGNEHSSLNGGKGNDIFQLDSNYTTIIGGDGDDTVYAWDDDNTGLSISGGAGNDYIDNHAHNSTIDSGTGDDVIGNWGDNAHDVSINSGAGNDTIGNNADTVTIDAGDGNDLIDSNGGSKVTIDAGDGDDLIDGNGGSNVKIFGGKGSDTVYNWKEGNKVTISGGDDKDYITNYGGSKVSISGGDGDDNIENREGWYWNEETQLDEYTVPDNAKIDGGKGNDHIYNYGNKASVNGGAGNDYIYNGIWESTNTWGANVTIAGGAGDDTISSEGSNVSISGGKGNDVIYNSGFNATISGGKGNDTVYNSEAGMVYVYKPGEGNDYISGFGVLETLVVDGAKFTTVKSGSDVLVKVGENTITLSGAASLAKVNIVTSTKGIVPVNVVENSTENKKIKGKASSNWIRNYADKVTITSGASTDDIYNSGSNVVIKGGGGYDQIRSYASDVSIQSGAQADKIISGNGDNVSIDAGKGNDVIDVYQGVNLFVRGGKGNDTVNLNNAFAWNGRYIFSYAKGDGNDVISKGAIINLIGGATIAQTLTSGSDTVLKIDSGSVTVKDTKPEEIIVVKNNKYSAYLVDVLNNKAQGKVIGKSSETATQKIKNYGENSKIVGGKGIDSIYNEASNSSINAGAGDDYLQVGDYNISGVTALGGAGNDTIYNNGKNASIDGGTGNDTIISEGESEKVTIEGGKGHDIIEVQGIDYLVRGGLGNDTVNLSLARNNTEYVFEYAKGDGNDVVSKGAIISLIDGAKVDKMTKSGSDTVIKIGSGSITVKDTKPADVEIVTDGNYEPYFGYDEISNNTPGQVVKIENPVHRKSKIQNSADNSKIEGGAGSDTINNWGANVSINTGDGNNYIYSYSTDGTIITGSGDDSVYTTNNDNDRNYIDLGGGANYIYNNGTNTTIKSGSTKGDTIYTCPNSENNLIICGDAQNTVEVNGSHSTVKGGNKEDYILVHGKGSSADGNDDDDVLSSDKNLDREALQNALNEEIKKVVENIEKNFLENPLIKSILEDSVASPYLKGILDLPDPIAQNLVNTIKETAETLQKCQNLDSDEAYEESLWAIKKSIDNFNDIDTAVALVNKGDGLTNVGEAFVLSVLGGVVNRLLLNEVQKNFNERFPDAYEKFAAEYPEIKAYPSLYEFRHAGIEKPYVMPTEVYEKKVKEREHIIKMKVRDLDPEEYDKIESLKIDLDTSKKALGVNTAAMATLLIPEYGIIASPIIGTVGNAYLKLENTYKKTTYLQDVHNGEQNVIVTFGEQFFNQDYGTVKKILKPNATSSSSDTLPERNFDIINDMGSMSLLEASPLNIFTVPDSVEASNTTLLGGNGNDALFNNDNVVTIQGDSGDDSIVNFGDYAKIYGGKNNDAISNGGDYVLLDLGTGNDTIVNAASHVLITSEKGENFIDASGDFNTIAVGNGADFIEYIGDNNSINAGDGDNYLELYGDQNMIGTGNGKDYVDNSGSNSKIETGTGNDKIFVNNGFNVTIDTGKGNDVVIIGKKSSNELVKYTSGNDSIYGFNETSTLSVGNGKGTYSTVVSDADIVVTVGKGKITLDGAVDLPALNINGKDIMSLTLTKSDAAKVTLESPIKTANASSRTSAIRIVGNTFYNSIVGSSKNDSLYGGNGDDYLSGGKGNDKIYGQNGADSLLGGKGNDSLWGGDGNDVFIYSAGKDVIADFTAGQDKIKIASGKISKSSLSGSDVIFTIGKGSLTVKNAKGKSISLLDSTGKASSTVVGAQTLTNSNKASVTIGADMGAVDASARTKAISITGNALANTICGGSKNDSIFGAAGNDSILGNDGNDKLYGDAGNDILLGGKGNDSLWGGAGNDSLWGDGSNDTFIYTVNEGTDKIFDYADGDMLKIFNTDGSDGFFKSSKYSGGDLTLTINGGGKIIFDDVASTTKFNINGLSYNISGSKLVKK